MTEKDNDGWKMDHLHSEFKNESDRAAVILAASIIDEELTSLLKHYLRPTPSSNDEVFDGATAPLGNFSSKITMSYRLGLISGKFSRDLHLIRKIRNEFAHKVYGCDFNDGSVKQRIDELKKSLNDIDEIVKQENLEKEIRTHRGLFLIISSLILFEIIEKAKEVNPIEEAILEYGYKDYRENKM
jgi:DNA-binding MltR family transcriptional regulator